MRNVFFSFHYQRDIWRANVVRNSGAVIGESAAGFRDASLWEEAKKKGDSAIKELIDEGLKGTTVTAVLIGAATANRKYVDYEIEKSIERGNGLLGLRIHNIKDKNGSTDVLGSIPSKLNGGGYPTYTWTTCEDFAKWVETAYEAAQAKLAMKARSW
ncbi:MAG TPA: TIR domain-containing protein [Pyrinomonadaceae bacterium]|nr:TIR domain-containing protein [Pyrinomonadaceae bacterium]